MSHRVILAGIVPAAADVLHTVRFPCEKTPPARGDAQPSEFAVQSQNSSKTRLIVRATRTDGLPLPAACLEAAGSGHSLSGSCPSAAVSGSVLL